MKFLLLLLCAASLSALTLIDRVVGIVGDRPILLSEVNELVGMAIRQSNNPNSIDSSQVVELQRGLLEKLIDENVMLAAAASESIDVKETEVLETSKDQMAQLLKNFPNKEALDKELEKSLGVSYTQYESNLRPQIRDKLVTTRLQQKLRAQMSITKADVEKFFRQYKDSIPPAGPSVNLSHIMLGIQADSAVVEGVRLAIQNIYQELQQGLSFPEAVAKYSQSPDTADGGDLGFIAKGELGDPVFEATAFNLELQTYSRPIRSRMGFHIVYLEERKDRKVRVRHILRLVNFTPQDTQKTWNRADSILKQVQDSASFCRLARQCSADPATAYKGGALGWFTQEELKDEYKAAVQPLAAGGLSPVIRIKDEYHIFRLNAKAEERHLNLEEDWQKIYPLAERFLFQNRLESYLTRWRKKVYIENRL